MIFAFLTLHKSASRHIVYNVFCIVCLESARNLSFSHKIAFFLPFAISRFMPREVTTAERGQRLQNFDISNERRRDASSALQTFFRLGRIPFKVMNSRCRVQRSGILHKIYRVSFDDREGKFFCCCKTLKSFSFGAL